MHYHGKSLIWFTLAITLLLVSGCRQDKIASRWNDDSIIIDGNQADWHGNNLRVPKGKHITVGVLNDESYLYLTLSTIDRALMMKALQLGFTVWLDPKGGTKEILGIKYPTGLSGTGQRSTMPDRGQLSRMPNISQMIRSLPESQPWIEILGPRKNDIYQIPAADTAGVQVRLEYSEFGQLVYEMKIPLGGLPDHPYSFAMTPGDKLGISLVTGSMGMSAMRGSRSGGGMPGGRPGGMPGGMPRGRPGGKSGAGMGGGSVRQTVIDPFSYRMRVTIAAKE
ncbi:hypothetical protein ACFL45_08055 [Candidatus Neomarinimicrobiota bacterium]